MVTSREIYLKQQPVGMPSEDDFDLVTNEVGDPAEGQVLVKNHWMSVDPYMRGRMTNRRSYIPPFEPGKVLEGGAIGEVVASKNPDFSEGDFVLSMNGWREYFLSDGKGLQKVDPSLAPAQSFLGALGMPGLTAYVGLLKVGALKERERVFVSAASGAVGSIVCQIAKAKGCYVVGSAGSADKCKWLEDVAGVDATINYKETGNLTKTLAEKMPEGIDVYFENVGGEHLQAALNNMRFNGRIALCGMIDVYNDTEGRPGPTNLANIIGLQLRVEGFIVSNYQKFYPEFIQDMGKWIAEGKMKWEESVLEGIDKAPQAFLNLFTGKNFGKQLVKLADG